MYEREVILSQSALDTHGELKLSAALDLMQDCELLQAINEKKLARDFADLGCGMFLVSRQLNVLRRPQFGERTTTRTWIYETSRVMGLRNTVIYDEKGEPCITSQAVGAFVNLTTGRPTAVTTEAIESIPIEPQFDMEYLPRRIALPTTKSCKGDPIRIVKSYIDAYHHTNNVCYISMALDQLPTDFEPNHLRVEYKNQAKLGDMLIPIIYDVDGGYIVVLQNEGGQTYVVIELKK